MRSALVPTKDFSFVETFIVHASTHTLPFPLSLSLSHTHRSQHESTAKEKKRCTIFNDDSWRIVKTIVRYYSTKLHMNAIAVRRRRSTTHYYWLYSKLIYSAKLHRATFLLCCIMRHGNDEMTNNVSIFSVSLPIIHRCPFVLFVSFHVFFFFSFRVVFFVSA